MKLRPTPIVSITKMINPNYMATIIHTTRANTDPSSKPLYFANRLVWYLLGIIEVLLAFRFALKLASANPSAGFTTFIYNVTYPLVLPFLNVFRITQVDRQVFEWTTILAMAVYWLIAWGFSQLFVIGKPVTPEEASEKLDEQDR